MKALEKDRSRRYETANGFAADVQRYLADEPVQACPPSVAYRSRSSCGGTRAVLAVSLVLLAFVAGIVGTTWQAIRAANRAEGERQAKERAEADFALANEAVEKYLGTVTDDPDLRRVDLNQLRKKLLGGAIPFFQRIAAQKSDNPDVEARRGRAYLRLARLRLLLGENEPAIQDAEAARAIFARLNADSSAAPPYRHGLASSHVLGPAGAWGFARRRKRTVAGLWTCWMGLLPSFRTNCSATSQPVSSGSVIVSSLRRRVEPRPPAGPRISSRNSPTSFRPGPPESRPGPQQPGQHAQRPQGSGSDPSPGAGHPAEAGGRGSRQRGLS
jgi:hypothetical protein